MAQKSLIKKPENSYNDSGKKYVKIAGKYNIPRNRKIVKRIKINNGELTAQIDADDNGETKKLYWFRNGKYITPKVLSKYTFYDKNTGLNISLLDYKSPGSYPSENGILPKIPYTKKIIDIDKLYLSKAFDLSRLQSIPFEDQLWITLHTKSKNGNPGTMNLADIPTNMLDSIAVNAGRSNTNFWTDMALVGKESTFGGISNALYGHRPNKGSVDPNQLVGNNAFWVNPYEDYFAKIQKKYPLMEWHALEDVANMEKDSKYAIEHGTIKEKTPKYSNYVLADAFKRYASNPYKYNTGQKNYVPMLNGIKDELFDEKLLQDYWNTRGLLEYARGQREGISKPIFNYMK